MVTTDHQLDEQIHSFLDRKTKQFPELEHIGAERGHSNLFTRVQDAVSSITHIASPRHSH